MRLPRDFLGRAAAMTQQPDTVARLVERPRSLAGHDWVPHWALAAHRAERHAAGLADPEARLQAIKQAAAYYSLAAYPAIADHHRAWAYGQARRTYRTACVLEGSPTELLHTTTDTVVFPSYLRRPLRTCRGVVLVLRGLDSTKEVTYWDERRILERGFAIVATDFPGMGEHRGPLTATTEHGYRAVIDAALTRLCAPTLPVTVWGLGFGGYWAYRLAAIDPRVVGAISIGGPVDRAFRPSWLRILGHLSEALFLQRIMRHALGPSYRGSVRAFVRQLSLVDVLAQIQAPLLYINGDRDVLVPHHEAEAIQHHASPGDQRDIKIFEGTSHLASEVLDSHVLPFCLAWVDDVLARRPAAAPAAQCG